MFNKVSEREPKTQRQRGIKFIGNQWRDQPVYKEQANDIHCHWYCQCAYCKHGRLDTKFDHSGNQEAATDLIVRLWFKKPEENIVFSSPTTEEEGVWSFNLGIVIIKSSWTWLTHSGLKRKNPLSKTLNRKQSTRFAAWRQLCNATVKSWRLWYT